MLEDKFRLAGFWMRFSALLLDELVIALPLYILLRLVLGADIGTHALVGIIYLTYIIVLPVVWKGYVVGKKIVHVRIVQEDGSNVTFKNMILRELGGAFIYLTVIGVVVSICMVILRPDRRSIHDFIGGTIVLEEPPRG